MALSGEPFRRVGAPLISIPEKGSYIVISNDIAGQELAVASLV
jgi:hypothetical protein